MAGPRLTDGTFAARLTLAADLLALGVFVFAGMRSHETASQLEVFARNAVPIAARGSPPRSPSARIARRRGRGSC